MNTPNGDVAVNLQDYGLTDLALVFKLLDRKDWQVTGTIRNVAYDPVLKAAGIEGLLYQDVSRKI